MWRERKKIKEKRKGKRWTKEEVDKLRESKQFGAQRQDQINNNTKVYDHKFSVFIKMIPSSGEQ